MRFSCGNISSWEIQPEGPPEDFFVKDRIQNQEFRVEYYPTHLMLADYFTKSLTGSKFREFRDVIMGIKSIDEIDEAILRTIKERVGN